MKKSLIMFATLLISTSYNVNAATVTGTLSYDSVTGIITDSATGGTTYLGWDVAASLTYAGTLVATSGGVYDGYHIASQAEAYTFYYASTGQSALTEPDTTASNTYQTNSDSLFEAGAFGLTYLSYLTSAWFLSDFGNAGLLQVSNEYMSIADQWGAIANTDGFAGTSTPVSWLLVADTQLIATPIPAAALMFAPALLGFMGLRRKAKKN